MRYLAIITIIHAIILFVPFAKKEIVNYNKQQKSNEYITLNLYKHQPKAKTKKIKKVRKIKTKKVAKQNPIIKPKEEAPKSKIDWELYTPSPQYPTIARKRKWQGEIKIKIDTDHNGHVIRTVVDKSTGFHILDKTAINTVKTWRVTPNLKDEVVPIVFRIR